MKSRVFYGWWVVAVGFVIMLLAFGIRYSYGVYFRPLADEFGWSRGEISGVMGAYMAIYGVAALVWGLLADRFGPRLVCASGALLTGVALILAGWVHSLWQLYLAYSVVMAVGMGPLLVPLTATVVRFFRRKRGLAVGLLNAGVGVGILLTPLVAQYIIQWQGWRASSQIMGLAMIAIGVPLAAGLLRYSPQAMGLLPDGDPAREIVPGGPPDSPVPGEEAQISLREGLRIPVYRLLVMAFTGLGFSVFVLMVHFVPHATDRGFSDLAAAWGMSVVGLAAAVGFVGGGSLSDRLGRRVSGAATFIGLAAAAILMLEMRAGGLFWASAATFGFFYGASSTIVPALLGDLLGVKAVAGLLGVMTLGAALGGAVGGWLPGYVFDVAGSYDAVFMATAAVSVLTAGTVLLTRGKRYARQAVAPSPVTQEPLPGA